MWSVDPIVASIIAIAVGAIFLVGAAAKIIGHEAFVAAVLGYRVLPAILAMPAAYLLISSELTTALALLIPATRTLGAVAALGLLAVVTMAVWINILRGRVEIDCGCGGADGQQLSYGLVLRNLALAACLTATLAPVTPYRPWSPFEVVLTLAASAVAAVFYFTANQLLANATRMRREAMS